MAYVLFATVLMLVLGGALIGALAWASYTDPADRDEEWVRSFQTRPAVVRVRHHRRS